MVLVKDVHFLRRMLKNNLFNKCNHNFQDSNYKEQYNKLLELLKRTILYNESNSLLLLGPPGSGKTFIVEKILEEISRCENLKDRSCLVQLNGLIHTDDKLALKSILKQLLIENDIEDCSSRSFSENLNLILECFKNRNSKSLIFCLEEFELFCSHHNQTLLYNLFDVSQSAQSPIFVLGITCNMSVVELLEKRVKSRFSHRKLSLFPTLEQRLNDLILKEVNLKSKDVKIWNKHISEVIQDANIQKYFKLICDITNNHNDLTNILFKFISQIENDEPLPGAEILIELFKQFYEEDSKVNVLLGLTVLEICLLIAMKHHTEIYDGQPFNFQMIHNRYKQFIQDSSSVGNNVEPFQVAVKAFQHIVQLELVVPISGQHHSEQIQLEHQMFKLNVHFEQIASAVKLLSSDLPTNVMQWASSFVI